MVQANGPSGGPSGGATGGVNGNGAAAGAPSRVPRSVTPDDLRHVADAITNALSISRQELLRELLDPRRDVEDECGYPRLSDTVGVELYHQLYQRDAIAARVVEVMPKEAFAVTPTVFETEDTDTITPFEEGWDGASQQLRGQSWYQDEMGSPIWEHILRALILAGIGQFGVMMLGVDDGQPLGPGSSGVVAGVVTKCSRGITVRWLLRVTSGVWLLWVIMAAPAITGPFLGHSYGVSRGNSPAIPTGCQGRQLASRPGPDTG